MLVAHVLSDLTSLQACDPSAARELVSAQHSSSTTISSRRIAAKPKGPPRPSTSSRDDAGHVAAPQNPRLERAYRLLHLHRSVKLEYGHAHPKSAPPDWGAGEARLALERSRSTVRSAAKSLGHRVNINAPSWNAEQPSAVRSNQFPSHKERVDAYAGDDDDDDDNEDPDDELNAWS